MQNFELVIFDIAVLVPDLVNTEEYPPFEPDLHEDFPTGSEFEPRIPHILHQTYKGNYIPHTYATNIKSFLKDNPDWKYFLWTEQSVWKLIIERYPSLLGTLTLQMKFKDLCQLLRYVVLYEFGGVYADMSVKWLRPIQKLTFKYACIFTPLPYERASLGFKKLYLLNNDLILCRAKHPFLKQIIDDIPLYQPMLEIEDSNGPHFLISQFMKYNKEKYYMPQFRYNKTTSNFPIYFKSILPEIHQDSVFVPNSKYFHFDLDSFFNLCNDFMYLSFLERRGCVVLQKRRGINKFAFTFTHVKRTIYETVLNFLFRTEISNLVGEHLKMF
jgi:mannosyltransferase OCH1-like enzyme